MGRLLNLKGNIWISLEFGKQPSVIPEKCWPDYRRARFAATRSRTGNASAGQSAHGLVVVPLCLAGMKTIWRQPNNISVPWVLRGSYSPVVRINGKYCIWVEAILVSFRWRWFLFVWRPNEGAEEPQSPPFIRSHDVLHLWPFRWEVGNSPQHEDRYACVEARHVPVSRWVYL